MLKFIQTCCILIMSFRHASSHTSPEASFHSSPSNDRMLHDRPRPRPKRRDDIPPAKGPIASSRHINYGPDGHPYERVRRLREEKEERVRRYKQRNLGEEIDESHYEHQISRILQNGNLYQPLRIHFDTVSDHCNSCDSHFYHDSTLAENTPCWSSDRLRSMVFPINPNGSTS